MSLSQSEFAALRQTIATRGTARIVLLPLTLAGWSVLTVALLLFNTLPIAVLVPLTLLAGGFEAIHALHVGVERVGRYLQVFYEDGADGPRWESTAMAVGPTLPGGGADPLFAITLTAATAVNLLPALLRRPALAEMVVLIVLHVALVIRIVRARGAAARQRAVELESFRALKLRHAESRSTPTV